MTDLAAAVSEWRDARQAIFDAAQAMAKQTREQNAPMWDRLAQAEHALMAAARLIPAPRASKAVPNS